MGEPEESGQDPDRYIYTLAAIERLLGFHEGESRTGVRHVTLLDLLSWAADPGGAPVWYSLALSRDPRHAWMARRGPLAPDSVAACVLYDFKRAMARLSLLEQAVVALTVAGFSPSEIAAVIDPDGIIKENEVPHRRRVLGNRQKRIARLLYGRPKRDAEGHHVTDDDGNILYQGGVAPRLARLMNGER